MPDYGGIGGVSSHKHSGASDGGALDATATLVGASSIKLLHAWGGAAAALDNTDLAAAAGIKLAQIGEIVKARLAADLASINGTEAILSVAILANKNYRFTFKALLSHGGVGSPNYQIHALASGALKVAVGHLIRDDNVVSDGYSTNTGISLFTGAPSSHVVWISGIVIGGAATDTIQIDLVSTTVSDTIRAGAFLEAEVIP